MDGCRRPTLTQGRACVGFKAAAARVKRLAATSGCTQSQSSDDLTLKALKPNRERLADELLGARGQLGDSKRFWGQASRLRRLPSGRDYIYIRGVVEITPRLRFSSREHRSCADGRASTRHLHGKIERTARCLTVKAPAESAGAVAR